MPKLTKRLLDGLEWNEERSRNPVWDTEVKGFGVRVAKSGRKTFVLKFRTQDGRIRWLTIGAFGSPWTVEDARTEARAALARIAAGEDPQQEKLEKRAALTVGELIDRYLAEGPADKPNKRQSSWDTDRSSLERHVRPLLGDRAAASLSQRDVAVFQDNVTAGKTRIDEKTGFRGRAIVRGGPGIAKRTVSVLGAMYSWAVRRGILANNPVLGLKTPSATFQPRFLSRAEADRLWRTLEEMEKTREVSSVQADALRLILLTGARRGEVLNLKWGMIDADHRIATLPFGGSKSERRHLHFGDLASALLKRRATLSQTQADAYVFPATKGDGPIEPKRCWERVRRRAGLENVRIHDLRHTFASFAVADGATLFQVQKTLGHKQSSTTEIYAHLRAEEVQGVVASVERQLSTSTLE